MQVRARRRRRLSADEPLPPLPPVEEGQFREVKTGVLLLPSERFQPSAARHSVLRRWVVSCLGDADAIFSRLWAKLQELGWLGPQTLVVRPLGPPAGQGLAGRQGIAGDPASESHAAHQRRTAG